MANKASKVVDAFINDMYQIGEKAQNEEELPFDDSLSTESDQMSQIRFRNQKRYTVWIHLFVMRQDGTESHIAMKKVPSGAIHVFTVRPGSYRMVASKVIAQKAYRLRPGKTISTPLG